MDRFINVAVLQRCLARQQRGQVFVLVGVALFAIMGIAALAIDVGNLWTARRLMQNAADAAAIAAVDSIESTGSYGYITSAAQSAASQNGFADGSTTTASTYKVSVKVYNPPQSGSYSGVSNAVQVVISQKQPTYFMRVLGAQTVNMSTVATGIAVSSGSCVFSLDPTNPSAVKVAGNAAFSSECGLYVNSDNKTSALTVSGGGTVTASVVGVVGGTNINGGGSTSPVTGIAAFGDPLSSVQAPTPSSCQNYHTQLINSSTSLSPGTFCGGLKITGSSTTVNLSPGTYIMNGGGLTIGSGATVTCPTCTSANGYGVTFYLTGANNSNGNASSYSGVTIDGTATVNLSAPCVSGNGGIQYMLFFQDRSISYNTSSTASTINGGSNSTFSGVMYFPTTTLNYAGNSSQTGYTTIVSYDLNITGTTNIYNNYCSGGNPIQHATLVQ